MSTPSTNVPQPQPSQGIPTWVGACIVGVVVLAGGIFLATQFMKEVPKTPTVRGTTRPGPGQPGGGPAPPAGGPTMGGPKGGGEAGGSEAGAGGGTEAGATGGSEAESGSAKAEAEKESK